MRFSSLISSLQQGQAGLKHHGAAADPELNGAASLEQAGADQLSFLEKGNALTAALSESGVGAVLLPDQTDLIAIAVERGLAYAVFKDPRLAFAESLELLHPRRRPAAAVHPTAVIHEQAVIACGVTIGPRVCVGAGSRIGSGSIIHPGVVIYDDVVVGV